MNGLFSGRGVAVIGGGRLQVPVIQRAKELGAFVVVVDRNPHAPGVEVADLYVPSSTLDAELTAEALFQVHQEKHSLHAVLTVGTDASYTVAVSAKRLGVPGIDPEVAKRATDKHLMRQVLRQARIPVPDFEMVESYPRALEVFERLGGDCVVKPVDNMGARGVRRVSTLEDLKEACDLAFRYTRSGKILIEQYIDGVELSVDALVVDGDIMITGVADRIIEYAPYFVETGHILPSQMPAEVILSGLDVFQRGVKALGITLGAAKGDIKVTPTGSFVGEIAARLSGGFMSTHTYPYATGVDLMENILRIHLGMGVQDLTPKRQWVSIERAIIPPPGEVVSIGGREEAENIAFVRDVFLDVKVGDTIREPQNNLDKAGHVIVCAPTYREALHASHQAVRSIKITTKSGEDNTINVSVLLERARTRFHGRCFVCQDCDGVKCRGMVPGVGGVGLGTGFIRAVERLRRWDVIPSYIQEARMVSLETSLCGIPLSMPVLPAPITGAITNLGGAIPELELARSIVKGANQAGLVGAVGDGATPTKYRIGIKVILENFGLAIPFFKPRLDKTMIIERLLAAEEAGAVAMGMDIDAASFLTMEMKKQATVTKSVEELAELIGMVKVPFLLKGILSPTDAKLAKEAGAAAIVVSHHGGRVSDAMIAPVDALPRVREAVGEDFPVILDGGIRSGWDVVRALALGADAVMIGRPVMIYAVGQGVAGVRYYFESLKNELAKALSLVGADTPDKIKGKREILYERS
ncbi:MAG: alpha-hydroxy-acid oxidizing protein [Brevinematales bacterium]|nr:alpha-hydroxy-acid oxidizing protein [Brevinematales bacterium]